MFKSYEIIARPVVSPTVIGIVIKAPGEALTLGRATVTGGVPVAVADALGVGDGPPPIEQAKSAVSNINDHPPSSEPTFVAASSIINKFQFPFIAAPSMPNADARVADPPGAGSKYVGPGAGA